MFCCFLSKRVKFVGMSRRKVNKESQELITKLGSQIRHLRLKKQMTQMDMAVLLNLDASAIRRYEKGRVEMGFTTLIKFAEALEVSLSDLIDFTTSDN